jgi:ABC-2 type transport system permease protein
MLQDTWTVVWKERKGLLRIQGSRWRAILTMILPVAMVAILAPIQLGQEWVDAAWSLMASVIIPLILIGFTIPESFAGERERHTLETLLASRLPDRAILLGKLSLAIGLGWGMTLASLLVGLIPVNAFHWAGKLQFYRLDVLLANVLLSLLLSCLMASLGILISLRAETTQGAQQALVSILLVPLMVVQVVPMLMLSVIPNGRSTLEQWLSVDLLQIILVAGAVLLVANVGLFVTVMARFQRARLCES